MRVLILGAAGMLGHKLIQILSPKHEITGTVRKSVDYYKVFDFFKNEHLIGSVDINEFDTVKQILKQYQPQFVINCIGIIKQLEAANDHITAISVNALLPHKLACACSEIGARLIHISTDCVFSGNESMYKESDFPNATDLYGRSKILGEVSDNNCLTLRTSIIGRELLSNNGLIEWFLRSDQTEVSGYRKAIYSGLTTIEFARVIDLIITSSKKLTGIYHVSSDPISKYDLLMLVRNAFNIDKKIVPADLPVIDRSLDNTRFRNEMDYTPPSWSDMIQELTMDKTPYTEWHKQKQK